MNRGGQCRCSGPETIAASGAHSVDVGLDEDAGHCRRICSLMGRRGNECWTNKTILQIRRLKGPCFGVDCGTGACARNLWVGSDGPCACLAGGGAASAAGDPVSSHVIWGMGIVMSARPAPFSTRPSVRLPLRPLHLLHLLHIIHLLPVAFRLRGG